MKQAILVAGRSEAVIQEGQPPAQNAAWFLPYDPDANETALSVAAAFAEQQGFPVGTEAFVIDMDATPPTIAEFRLVSSWEAVQR